MHGREEQHSTRTKDGFLLLYISGRNHQTQRTKAHTHKQLVQFHPLFHMTTTTTIIFILRYVCFYFFGKKSGEIKREKETTLTKNKRNKVEEKNKNHSRDRQACQNGTHTTSRGSIMSIQKTFRSGVKMRGCALQHKGLEKELTEETSPALLLLFLFPVCLAARRNGPSGPATPF